MHCFFVKFFLHKLKILSFLKIKAKNTLFINPKYLSIMNFQYIFLYFHGSLVSGFIKFFHKITQLKISQPNHCMNKTNEHYCHFLYFE